MNSQATVFEGEQYVDAPLFQNPYFATGYPLTEAYWARIKVGGTAKDVLIQVFERRVLTYTPGNDPAWQVEAGNVGQHYYIWRYHTTIPTEPQGFTLVNYLRLPPAPIMRWEYLSGADATMSFGNQSPYTMFVQLDGPVSRFLSLAPCPTCIVYANASQVTSCLDTIEWKDTTLPPGNYRVQISYTGGNVRPGAGDWTIVSDADYGSCWFVVEDPDGSPGGQSAHQ
jgi:hypothetical protein